MRFIALLCTMGLAACGAEPSQDLLLPTKQIKTVPNTQTVRMFVVTSRGRRPEQPLYFDTTRAPLGYLSFDISLPPGHRPSNIEWPRATPDPETDFVVTGRTDYDLKGFLNALPSGRKKVDVSLYIHGYNNNFPESVYRATQIAADADADAVPVLFAWPSIAHTAGYVADRDAADFSRAGLADLIARLAEHPRIGRVFVIGHSMGGRLTMEALMQLSLADRRGVLREVEVVLADPDIDQDLFWEQARIVGRLTVPISVITAPDDKALKMSKLLAAGRTRIGMVDVADPQVSQRAEAMGVRLVDVTSLETDGMAHNRIVQIASLYNRMPAATGGVRQAGAFVLGTIGLGMTQIGTEMMTQ